MLAGPCHPEGALEGPPPRDRAAWARSDAAAPSPEPSAGGPRNEGLRERRAKPAPSWRTFSAALGLLLLAASGAGSPGHRFLDLWMTPDQQGMHYLDEGDPKTAAERFKNPAWRGVCLYRTGDFQGALNAFALSDAAESYYNQGNALAHLGKYPEAVKSYQDALERRHGWKDAQDNLALVRSLIPPPKKKEEAPRGNEPPAYKPDQIQFDDTKGQKGKVQVPRLDEKQLADMWLRNIQTTPADFLRQKFAIQVRESAAGAGGATK